jgi:phosphatidate cytidylyltransferase
MKRTVTGLFIVLCLAALLFLRLKVGAIYFDIAVFLIIFFGVNEMVRAFKEQLTPILRIMLTVFSAFVFVPFYFFGGFNALIYYILCFFAVLSAAALFDKNITLQGISAALTIFIYPTLPLAVLLVLNNMPEGFSALLLLFAVACLTDVAAFAVGCTLGKGKCKLCPEVSPNKTVIGACGGIAGGVTGAVAVYFVLNALNAFNLDAFLFNGGVALVCYIVSGIFMSVFTQLGDLTASLYKRKLGIKDYGKIFPGHGGVMDRFDGVMFAAVFLVLYIFLVAAI